VSVDLSRYKFEYDEEDTTVTAKFNGKEVGRFELWLMDDGYTQTLVACHLNVDKEHRRKGVATELVRVAVGRCEPFVLPSFIPPSTTRDLESCDYYTQEGSQLFWACKKKGIVPESYFREEPAR
jgi:GNAT superfamily N-acetyltransferase